MGIMLTLLTGIVWGGIGIVLGMATRRRFNVLAFMTCASLLSAIGAWIMLIHWPALLHGHVQRGPQLFLLMSITGVFGTLGMFALQKAMTGGAAAWSMGQSAMVIPFAFGVFVMREALTPWGILGMVAIVLSLIAFAVTCNGSSAPVQQKSTIRWFHFALWALCLLGTEQTLSTIPSNWHGWSDTAGLRVPLVLTMGAIPLLVISLRQRRKFERAIWGLAFLYALLSILGQRLIFMAMDLLRQAGQLSLAYPIAISLCMVVVAVWEIAVWRKRPGQWEMVGLLFAVFGVVLLSM